MPDITALVTMIRADGTGVSSRIHMEAQMLDGSNPVTLIGSDADPNAFANVSAIQTALINGLVADATGKGISLTANQIMTPNFQ